jgi:hypothetical protein
MPKTAENRSLWSRLSIGTKCYGDMQSRDHRERFRLKLCHLEVSAVTLSTAPDEDLGRDHRIQ